jgi:DNA-binding transcriptional regulator YiaG
VPRPHRRLTPAATVELARLRYEAAQRVADGSAIGLRKEAGLSQGKIAHILGVSVMAVSNWERGFTQPEPASMLAWLALLDRLERGEPALAATGTEGPTP